MRIAIAGFADETCTFTKEPTGIERFEPGTKRGQVLLDEAADRPGFIYGFMNVLGPEGVEMVPLLDTIRGAGGFSSWLTTECFDKYANEIAQMAADAGKLDGVLLSMHGAMAVTGVPRPEAEVVKRVRKAVGNIPIMVTLDLHANEDEELALAADAVFILKTYPHLDSDEIGQIAARCMIDTVRGKFKPTMGFRRPGILSASIYQGSDFHPMKDIYDRAKEWETKPGVYCVSVAPGYAYADVVDAGMSIFVVTNDDKELAEKIAQDMSDFAWSLHESFSAPLPDAKDATALAMKAVAEGNGPVLIADGADRIGDGTYMLEELLRVGTKNWGIPGIADPVAAKWLEENAEVGQEVTVKIGGWYGDFSNKPIEVTGKVIYKGKPVYKLVGPMGKGNTVKESFICTLDLGDGRYVVVSEKMRGANDSSGFTSAGIDYTKLDIIVLKDRVHHRAYWDTVTKTNIRTSVPGEGPADILTLHYENVDKDIYPIGARWRKDK